jgi:hypothetical protein
MGIANFLDHPAIPPALLSREKLHSPGGAETPPLGRYGGLKRTLPSRLPTSPLAEAYDEAGDVEGHFVPVTLHVVARPNC